MLRNQNRVGTIYRKSPDAKLTNNKKQNIKQHIKSTFTDKNTQINSNVSGEQSLYALDIPLSDLPSNNSIHKGKEEGQRKKKYSCYQMRGCQFKPSINEYDLSHLSESTVKDQSIRNEEDSINLNFVEDYKEKGMSGEDPNSLVRKLTYLNNIFKELKMLKENRLPYDICLILSRVEDQFIDIERTIIKQIQE